MVSVECLVGIVCTETDLFNDTKDSFWMTFDSFFFCITLRC